MKKKQTIEVTLTTNEVENIIKEYMLGVYGLKITKIIFDVWNTSYDDRALNKVICYEEKEL